MNSIKLRGVLFGLILFCGMASGAKAQDVDTMPVRGFMPNMDQLSSSIDNIDIATGKLNLTIPLGSLPRGKGGTSYELSLQYESNIYDSESKSGRICYYNYITTTCGPWPGYTRINPAPALGGWRYNSKPYRIEIEEKYDNTVWYVTDGVITAVQNLPCSVYDTWVMQLLRYRVILPDGSAHILYLKGNEYHEQGGGFYPISMNGIVDACYFQYHNGPQTVSGLQTWYTIDGSNLKYEVWATGQNNTYSNQAAKLYFPDGRVVEWEGGTTGIVREIDANGNAIKFETICTGTVPECANGINRTDFISDADDRTITIEYGWEEDAGWKRDRVSIPGPNGNSIYYIDWEPQLGAALVYSTGIIPGNPNVSKNEVLYIGFKGLKYINLPTATQFHALGTAPAVTDSYEFGYWLSGENCNMPTNDGFGMLNLMRTPSGSEYRYVYGYRDYLPVSGFWGDTIKLVHGAYVCKKTVTTTDTNQELKWEFDNLSNKTTVKKPDGNETIYHYNYKPGGWWDSGLLNLIEEYEGATKKRERKQEWTHSGSFMHGGVLISAIASMTKEIVSVFGSANKSAITTYNRDVNGNLLEKTEYDWISCDAAILGALGTITRKTTYDYYTPSGAKYWEPHNTTYWPSGGSRRLNAVKRVTVYDGSNVAKAATEYVYDDPYTTGNMRYERHWDNTKPGPGLTIQVPATLTLANSQEYEYRYDQSQPYGNYQYGNLTDIYEPAVSASSADRPHKRITYDSEPRRVFRRAS